MATAEFSRQAVDAVVHETHDDRAWSDSEHTPCFTDEGQRQGVLALLTGQLLVARAGFQPYISSDFEQRGPRRSVTSAAHDFYLMPNPAEKVPIKVLPKPNRKGGYSPRVIRLPFSSILHAAVNTFEPAVQRELLDLTIEDASELVADETLGADLYPEDITLVDKLAAETKRIVDAGITRRT
jgi:hypothetical protein